MLQCETESGGGRVIVTSATRICVKQIKSLRAADPKYGPIDPPCRLHCWTSNSNSKRKAPQYHCALSEVRISFAIGTSKK
ncbi:uncharacterized protein LOC143260956 isoform X2 [Megalopta genalis]|uniref:uncharacterized protein LOC143260956 isoform X2 n=1 Tax=Megalopta genalis TaxID=115081 RepID=UPI003FD56B9E